MTDLAITGTGALTSVGFTAAQAYSSIRAGIDRFVDHPIHFSVHPKVTVNDPEPLTCSPVATIDALMPPQDRLLRLALHPLEETFNAAQVKRGDVEGFGVFLAAPPQVEGIPEWGLDDGFLAELLRQTGLPPFPVSLLKRPGATGFMQALKAAQEALDGGACRFALVGGADSFLDEASVRHFDETYRLLSERNRDGFIPGEGAAWIIVESSKQALERGVRVLASLQSIGFGHEPNHILGELNSSGVGLSTVFEQLTENRDDAPFWVIADLNGESYRAYEWGLMRARLAQSLEQLSDLWHPANCTGDLRAAGPAFHAVLACQAFEHNDAPAEQCLVFCGDDQGARAGCMLKKPSPP